jgi:hypothetical protein
MVVSDSSSKNYSPQYFIIDKDTGKIFLERSQLKSTNCIFQATVTAKLVNYRAQRMTAYKFDLCKNLTAPIPVNATETKENPKPLKKKEQIKVAKEKELDEVNC